MVFASFYKQLTIIGRGWAKYRDLPAASRSIICQSYRLRQIIDLRDTDKSRYFAITEFDNCFIIRSQSLFFLMNIFGKRSDLLVFTQERSQEGWPEYYLQPNTVGRYCEWADYYLYAVIYRSRGGLSANEMEEKFALNDYSLYLQLS